MKRQNVFPALIIFSIFLVSGLLTGRWIGRSLENQHNRTASALKQKRAEDDEQAQSRFRSFAPQSPAGFPDLDLDLVRRPTPEQRNILLVGVDHLGSPSPTLESIWLILYIQDMPQITWMPVYPEIAASPGGVQIRTDPSLEGNLQLHSGSLLPEVFLQALREKSIHWDNYLILDQAALAGVIDALGGLERLSRQPQAEDEKLDGLQAIAALIPVKENSQAAMLSQAFLIQQLCRTSPQSHFNLNRLQSLFKLLDSHLATDLEPGQIMADMNSMLLYGGGFKCEFPSLMLLSSEVGAPTTTK